MDDLLARAERLRRMSRFSEALALFKRALRKAEDEDRVELLMSMGDTYRMTGKFWESERYYSQAMELARGLREYDLATDASIGLALSRRALGDWKTSLRLLGTAENRYRKHDDEHGVAFALWSRAGALRIKGDIPEAIKTFRAAHRAFKSLKDERGVGYCLCGLGGTTRVRGHFGQSLKYYSAANSLFRRLRDTFGTAYSHCGIGNALRMKGDFGGAKKEFRRAIVLYRRIGDIVSYSYTLWSMGKTYMLERKAALSEKYFRDALSHFRKTRDPRGVIYCRLGMAELRALSGRKRAAQNMLDSALRDSQAYGFAVEACHAKALRSVLEGLPGNECYRKLGLKLKFDSIPFNIP